MRALPRSAMARDVLEERAEIEMPPTRSTWIKATPLIALFPLLAPIVALAPAACSSADLPSNASRAPAPSNNPAPSDPGTGNGTGSDSDAGAPPAAGPTENDAGSTPASDGSAGGGAGEGGGSIPSLPGWTLVWNDEFNLPNGSAADPTKWTNETGNSGWSNNQERQYYTPGTTNANIQDGSLVITAATQGASAYKCQYGTCLYTSARLNTSGKFTQQYGRFEARIKLPSGQGMWPAFWTLGNNIGSVGWPKCGEMDIMENVGKTPATNYGSLHGPGYSGGKCLTGSTSLSGGATLADDFHIYAIEWAANVVKFFFDGNNYETRTPADVPAGDVWVYDHPFFIILNLAVGGNFPGDPNASTTFPQTMTVDYVRVYSPSP
jgi:beta-glucanase (GH16 family)